MNESIQFLRDYCDFSNPHFVWILKGMSRNKDNQGNPNMDKFMRRMVVTCTEDIETCYNEIHLLANDPNTAYRIYVSLNARNVVNAAFQFQKQLVDLTQGLAHGRPDALQMAKKVGSLWKTELEQMHARGTKRFLFDLDVDNEFFAGWICSYLETKAGTKVHACRKTVSGYAIVFDACDTRGLIEYCKEVGVPTDKNTLQKDAMLFVEQFRPSN